MGKSRYAELLTHYPVPILAIILVVVCSCTLLSILVAKPPDFSDPLQGFVPRHTDIHSSYRAWRSLVENTAIGTGSRQLLTLYPNTEQTTPTGEWNISTTPTYSRLRRNQVGEFHSPLILKQLNNNSDDITQSQYDIRKGADDVTTTSGHLTDSVSTSFSRVLSEKEEFFCDSKPRKGYAQLAISTGKDLKQMDLDTFTQLCKLQTVAESSKYYEPVCQSDCMCRSFSFVNYVTYLTGQKSCQDITQSNLDSFLHLVEMCRPYYDTLHIDCWYDGRMFHTSRCNVSAKCANEAIFELFHYIISEEEPLTLTFMHVAQGKHSHSLYEDLLDRIEAGKRNNVRLLAMNFGLKEYEFEQSLKSDTCWISLALIVVILIIWLYTESIFITFMVCTSMMFTIILSYTLYQFVFRISYFPFLNLLSAVVVIGIGADDLFIYWKTWMAIKHSRNASILERIVTHTFRHASAAMFVTSASTATAFYACTYTDVVAIRCFCIYAGTCVLVHYLLVITWLPACVVVYEKYALTVCHTYGKESKVCKYLHIFHSYSTKLARFLCDRQSLLSTLSYIWLPIFLVISLGGALALFVWPKLAPPSSDMFQMLSAKHPFEIFDRDVKKHFKFTSAHDYLPLTFVFGVSNKFNGGYFDISSHGFLTLKPLPDLSLPETQLWFSNFCWELRQQPFFDDSQPNGCFIEELRSWTMFRSCDDDICCRDLVFPYNQSEFSYCLDKFARISNIYQPNVANPGMRYKDGKLSAVIISFLSNVKFEYNFNAMQTFYQNITEFLEKVAVCPESSCEHFTPIFTATGGLLFYDIQSTLLDSLPMSLIVVLSASCIIIFLTTLNVLLTLTALITISCSLLTTLGTLALIGWELNILESVIVSLAVGLSMDFPLHIVVAYRIASSTLNKKRRIVMSLRHVSGSLTAAMCTTLVAGICMLPAQVVAYTKLGTFLALVILYSWLYSMFFMPALLVHIGPVGSFLQLNFDLCSKSNHRSLETKDKHMDKNTYSDEHSSEVAQSLPTTSSQSQLAPVAEESEEQLELDEMEQVTPSSSLLESDSSMRYEAPYSRLSPIAEMMYESDTSI